MAGCRDNFADVGFEMGHKEGGRLLGCREGCNRACATRQKGLESRLLEEGSWSHMQSEKASRRRCLGEDDGTLDVEVIPLPLTKDNCLFQNHPKGQSPQRRAALPRCP